jgi:hypothetical protein
MEIFMAKPRSIQIADREYNGLTKVTELGTTFATYAKLLTNQWGLRATGDVFPGMKIKVYRKDGRVDEKIVGKIREKKGQFYYCEIAEVKRLEDGSDTTRTVKP